MSDISSTSPQFDPWTDGLAQHGDVARLGRLIHVEVIEDVVPLDRQFGIWPKRCVPLLIEPVLFGPHMRHGQTFALLDGALIEGLQERLEDSDLPHVCLFQGRALEDWGHVAPWLVELQPQHDLTRDLFTKGRDGGLWSRNAALYLRSALDLTQLRDFLRKLSRIRDASGRWIQFRFWAAPYLSRYVQKHDPKATPYVTALLSVATLITPEPVRRQVTVVRNPSQHRAADTPVTGVAADRWAGLDHDLARIRYDLFLERLDRRMCRELPAVAELPETRRLTGLRRMADAARAQGLRDEGAVERYCIATLLMGHAPEHDPRCQQILDAPLHGLDKAKRILDLALTPTG